LVEKTAEQRLYENAAQMPTHKANAGRHIRKAKRYRQPEQILSNYIRNKIE